MKLRRIIRTRHHRIIFEKNWQDRPHPYWFNAKYFDGMRRICIPFFTIDLNFR